NQNRFGPPQGYNRSNNFNQEPSYQATAQHNQNCHLNELERIKKMNDVSMKAMQNQIDMVKNELRNEMKTSIQTSLSNQINEIRNMMASLLQINTASPSSSGTLPSNTVANPKSNLKAITTRCGVSYDGPSKSPPVVENALEANKDTVIPTNNGNTKDVQPQAVSSKPPVSTSEPANTHVSASKPNPQASIPYPSMRNDERNREKAKDQIEKFYQIFKDMSFEISFTDALILMPKFASTLKALIELADRLISRPVGVAEDVYVKVGSFHFPVDFVIIDFDADPRVPLILERSFLKTEKALIDVFEAPPAIVDPLRIEYPFLEDQFQDDPPKDPPKITMTDNRTMAEMLRAPTEGTIRMITFVGAARRWLEKEPPRSITTWEDLVSKFINEFFPPSRTTSLRSEISNFEQKFGESFHEAWERYKDLLCACPHHGFTELHQLNTFYNALNPTDQDSLNAAAGGNLLERSTQDVITIIENKSKVRNSQSRSIASQVKACDTNSSSEIAKLTHAVNQQTSAMTTAMTAMLRQFQATPPSAPVKAVKETCVTCGGARPYYQCLAADGNTFHELKNNN
nr:reverse transcriptase domain-containing protein [Tanacetum cinerariifolium]